MAMYDPPHPGLRIRMNCLVPLGLRAIEAAQFLGVTRKSMNRTLDGRSAISPEMAIRPERAGWSNAEFRLWTQWNFDLARTHRKNVNFEKQKKQPQPIDLMSRVPGLNAAAHAWLALILHNTPLPAAACRTVQVRSDLFTQTAHPLDEFKHRRPDRGHDDRHTIGIWVKTVILEILFPDEFPVALPVQRRKKSAE